jgi:hypothetical protein
MLTIEVNIVFIVVSMRGEGGGRMTRWLVKFGGCFRSPSVLRNKCLQFVFLFKIYHFILSCNYGTTVVLVGHIVLSMP